MSSNEQKGASDLGKSGQGVDSLIDLGQIVDDIQELSKSTKELFDSTKKLQEDAKAQQGIIANMLAELRHSQGIVYFGFIILIFMMIAVIVDVMVNVWKPTPQLTTTIPQIIYVKGQ